MNQTWWTVLTAVAGLGMAACLYVMHGTGRGIPGLKALDGGFQSLDMRFHYGSDQAFACLDGVGSAGRPLLRGFWLIDFAFIACFLMVMLAITRNTAQIAAVRYGMYAAAMLCALLDAVENAMLLRVCAAYPEKRLCGLAAVAGYVTSAKWITLGVWLLGLFAGLFASAFELI